MVNRTNIIYSVLISLIFYAVNISAATVEPDKLECIIKNKKMGLRDRLSHKMVVPCKYEKIESANKDLYKVKINGLWGLVNNNGVTVVSPKFNELGVFGDCGLAKAKTAEKWGFVNTNGKFVIPEKFDAVENFGKNKYCSVQYNGKWGLIDGSNKVLIDYKYDKCITFVNGFARVSQNNLFGILNVDGKETVPCKYVDAWFLTNNLIQVKSNDKWGYIDVNGNVIIPFKYKECYDKFSNGSIGLKDETGAYIFASDARILASFPGKSIYQLQNYDEDEPQTFYAVVKHSEKSIVSIVNSTGKQVSPVDYQDFRFCYNNGLIAVQKNDKWGFIDKSGKVIINFDFDDVNHVYGGKGIAVKKGNKWGMIGIKGEVLIPFEYELIDQNYIYSKVLNNGKMGALSSDLQVILPVKYDDISYPDLRLGYYPVKLNGQDGYADFYGNDTF